MSIYLEEATRDILMRDEASYSEMMKDSSILKTYQTAELLPEYAYLPFIVLGIKYLIRMDELDDAYKGRSILDTHLQKIIRELYERR